MTDATDEAVASPKALLIARARNLRRNATDAEKCLWSLLRDRQMMGVKFRRQHRVGPYIADFAATLHTLIIELDGGQHTDANHATYDAARTEFLKSEGWHVLRFWNNEVLKNLEGVARIIADTLTSRAGSTLTPTLSLREGEGATAPVAAGEIEEVVS